MPPYEDQSGLWAEAAFLAESGFDYYGLLFEQHAYTDEVRGPRSYFISLVPAVVALLMIWSSSPRMAVVVAHLATFAFASGVLLLAFDLLRRFQPRWIAALFCLALVTTPFFSTQVDMVGMDIPMALFALLAARAAVDDRIAAALGWATLTFFTKASGGVVTGAIVGYLSLLVLLEWGLADRAVTGRHRVALAWAIVVFLGQYYLVNLVDNTLPELYALQWPIILRLTGAIYWCPDVVGVLLLTAITVVVAVLCWLTGTWQESRIVADRLAKWRSVLLDSYLCNGPAVFAVILLAGVVWTVSWVIFVPRYMTIGLPFLYVVLAASLGRLGVPRAVLVAGFASLAGFNLMNSSGRYFPAVEEIGKTILRENPFLEARSCVFRERSREYLAIHRSDIIALDELSRRHADDPLFITLPLIWQAKDPKLGMVAKPLRCFDTHDFAEAISNYREQCRIAPVGQTPILAWNREGRVTVPIPRDDDVQLIDDPGPDPLPLYRSAAMEQVVGRPRWEIEERYLDESWDSRWIDWRARARLTFLVMSGRLERALREIEAASELEAAAADLSDAREVVRQIAHQGFVGQRRVAFLETQLPMVAQIDVHLAEGLAILLNLPRLNDPDDPPVDTSQPRFRLARPKELSLFSQGVWKLFHRDTEGAWNDLLAAQQDGVTDELAPVLGYAIAVIASTRGDTAAALRQVQEALELNPEFPEARALLGELLAQLGRWEEAQKNLVSAVIAAPRVSRFRNLWGVALARLGRRDDAAVQFDEAVRLGLTGYAEAEQNRRTLPQLP
ncbi:MAG: tetratricopeptide repeat protein [Pirellulales bacterium]